MIPVNQIICGDTLQVLKTFPDSCIDCIVTSPPYYGLRDYGINGQLGAESSMQEYIEKMLQVTAELYRVLKPTGSLWWNHGDSYDGDKSLTLQNFQLVQNMILQEWILRNVIIWHKPNCMPQSVKDRFTVDFEPVFFLTKSKKYYFETQFDAYSPESDVEYRQQLRANKQYNTKEPYQNNTPYMGQATKDYKSHKAQNPSDAKRNIMLSMLKQPGRIKRTVWSITTQPFKDSHFATFPEKLITTPIRAGCPEFVCSQCGTARNPIFEPSEEYAKLLGQSWTKDTDRSKELRNEIGFQANTKQAAVTAEYIKTGYTDCGCDAGFHPGIVFDPFMGSGTTALVAIKNNRNYLGIELNPEYIKIANRRIAEYYDRYPIFYEQEAI